MAKAYSLDLRKKVVEFISQGNKKRKAAKVFNIGKNTIHRWLRSLAKGEDLVPKKRTYFETKVSSEILIEYVNKHPDHTLKEIGAAVGLHYSRVQKRLKKLKIILKKKRHFIKNVTK